MSRDYYAPSREYLRDYVGGEFEEMSDEDMDTYIEDHSVIPHEGDAEDYARYITTETGHYHEPGWYFDHASFGRDLKMDSGLTYHMQDDLDSKDNEVDDAQREVEDAQKSLSEAHQAKADATDKDERADAQEDIESYASDLEYYEDELAERKEEHEQLEADIDSLESLPDEKYSEEYIEQLGDIKELGEDTLQRYYDFARLGKHMEDNSEITEIEFNGRTWTIETHGV